MLHASPKSLVAAALYSAFAMVLLVAGGHSGGSAAAADSPGGTAAGATVYRVGPGEVHATVSEVAERLEPGDVVEVTGDITDSFVLSRHGRHDAPITVRGAVRAVDGRLVRPAVILNNRDTHGITVTGDWNVIEGLDISGASSTSWIEGTAIFYKCRNLLIRNCRIHHCRQGVLGHYIETGHITIEFSEFEANGGRAAHGSEMHSLYLRSAAPGAVATVEHCWFHDATGGNFLKSRYPRNVIRYNWFESPFYTAVYITDFLTLDDESRQLAHGSLYPMHSDIVGNVFFQGWSPGDRFALMRLGGEREEAAGTEGDFHVAHNLFVTTRRALPGVPDDSGTHMRVSGNVESVRLYNNVFMEMGVESSALFSRGAVWENVPATAAFRQRRGHGEPIVEGANNWASVKATLVPDEPAGTLRGVNPMFRDFLNLDFRPAKDSPLAGAGLWPLPQGRIVELVPEYEPQRGIPADLTPTPRRKVSPPSVGPFEALE